MTTPKILPARPSLESLRKQAKKLARDASAENAATLARIRAQLPDATLPLTQRDAQLVLAREYGFAGWRDLRASVLKRIGKGLEWAAAEAERATYENDLDRLRRLLSEYPGLLSWRDEFGMTLLNGTTSYANDTAEPKREAEYNRPDCAALLIDAGAVIQPSVWERVISTGASGMLQLLWGNGVLPSTLPILAALGNVDGVRRCAGDLRATNEAFLYACRFRHKEVATHLLDRCLSLDAELGRRVERWQGRAAFVDYLCANASPAFGPSEPGVPPPPPWRAFVMRQLMEAMDGGDLAAFTGWLREEPSLLGEASVPFQVELIEQASYRRNCGGFIAGLLDLDPAVLRLRPPPRSSAMRMAVEYGNAGLVPLLQRIWPLPDDLPHAAGLGDFARVRRWFDPAGLPALGNLRQHYPVSHPLYADPGFAANDAQAILDTALAWACMNRQLEVASFLLEHGADINTRWATHEPASILHECALYGNFEAARFLIDRGINLTIRCHRYNATAAGWAYNAAKDMKMYELLDAAEREREERSPG